MRKLKAYYTGIGLPNCGSVCLLFVSEVFFSGTSFSNQRVLSEYHASWWVNESLAYNKKKHLYRQILLEACSESHVLVHA